MPTAVAVADPALMMLTKAVAVVPTCTERLTGRIAATSGCRSAIGIEVTRWRNEIWLTQSPSVATACNVQICSTPVAFTGDVQLGLCTVVLLKLPGDGSVGHDELQAYCTSFANESSTVTATATAPAEATGLGEPPVLLVITWLWPEASTLTDTVPVAGAP